MSFPSYPEYKDSGAEWLGKVPAHWQLPRIGAFTRFCGGGTPPREVLSYWTGDIPWVSPKDMKFERINGAGECITKAGLAASAASMIERGSVLLVVRSGILKHTIPVAINDVPVALNQDMKALRFSPDAATSDFFLRWVQGLNDQLLLVWAKQGATVESVEHSYLASTVMPLPPVEEQAAIAAFLDGETAKIDALIAEQEKLLALLAEKRQATISHAVTRGLTSNVPLRPSGVSWLGDIPAHWGLVPLKELTDPSRPIMYGIVLPGPDVGEGGIPILKGGNVRPSRMRLSEMARTTAEIEKPYARARLRAGDLVYSIRGSIGDCEMVPPELAGSNITQDVARIAVHERHCADWVRWALLSTPVREDLASGSLGAAIRGVNIFDLKRARLPTPPRGEQEKIARHLNDEASSLDRLAAECGRAVSLLHERRTALITAAVTGQIDVRNGTRC